MATFEKRKHGWFVRINKYGIREGRTFDTKKQAEAWGEKREAEVVLLGNDSETVDEAIRRKVTLRECFERYILEVSSKKSGEDTELREQKRYNQLASNPAHNPMPSLMDKPVSAIKAHHIAEWKTTRLNHVRKSSVLRDKNFLSHVFSMAKEWGYISETPFGGKVKFEGDKESERERRVSEQEIKEILYVLDDWDRQRKPHTTKEKVALLWCLCLETGMRMQEAKYLEPDEVDLQSGVIDLPGHKVKEKRKKSVGLTLEAIRLIQLGRVEGTYWFGTDGVNVSGIFSQSSKRTTANGLQFRDSRHEGLTRLSEKLEPFELARQAGHRDMNRTLKYYRKTAREFGQKLR